RQISILVFSLLMAMGCLTGSLFFLRPSKSAVEKRDLTPFPAFTFSSFMDGSYFSQISTWYADTYPGRDALISMNSKIKDSYGIQSDTMMVGQGQADQIPTETSEKKTTKKKKKAELPQQEEMAEEMQDQIMQGLYIKNGAAYGMYYFTQASADTYIEGINGSAKKLAKTTDVYSILVPNNSIVLDKETIDKLGGSNQAQAIEYYMDSYSDKVKGVNCVSRLRKHRDEYLYFKTDHHWTALGAYYAYQEFCEVKGIKPHKLSYFKKQESSPFLGSYYSELQLSEMEQDPDTVTAYIPKGTNKMTYWRDGQEYEGNVVSGPEYWDENSYYMEFINGDQPLCKITNPKVEDDSSCVILKESYGNCFVPFLVDHYHTIYVMDFRYTDEYPREFCQKNKIDDLIVINNIQIIGSSDVSQVISEMIN
ncbi:MAG: hypothetical protein J6D18_04195, partial [Erysipelotrichaceae bacterium]|nr:hypothetical protein [Erysipelotrichaceae bacterium]